MASPGISEEQKRAFAAAEFKKLDLNNNGEIDFSEFQEYIKLKFPDNSSVMARNIFESMDTNKNGKLSKDEFKNIFDKMQHALELKIREDNNQIVVLSNEIKDMKEAVDEIEETLKRDPRNKELAQKCSLGVVTLIVENISAANATARVAYTILNNAPKILNVPHISQQNANPTTEE